MWVLRLISSWLFRHVDVPFTRSMSRTSTKQLIVMDIPLLYAGSLSWSRHCWMTALSTTSTAYARARLCRRHCVRTCGKCAWMCATNRIKCRSSTRSTTCPSKANCARIASGTSIAWAMMRRTRSRWYPTSSPSSPSTARTETFSMSRTTDGLNCCSRCSP